MTVPDFVIIGAMKSGTTTLHEQLARQPQFFMSEPKEPNFFSDDAVFARGRDWYESLFAAAPAGAIKGESSTHYTKLPDHPHTVERIGETLPDARFVYVMRHPIDRLISHYIHAWTERETSAPIDQAIDDLPALIDYSRYAYQISPWIEAFGRERILPVFFERLMATPQDEFARICKFLGAKGAVEWSTEAAANASAKRMRKHPALRLAIDNPFAVAFRRRFVPKNVRDRMKDQLVMKERPALSDASQKRLRAIFDEDLASLSELLGGNLNCACFKDAARAAPLGWL